MQSTQDVLKKDWAFEQSARRKQDKDNRWVADGIYRAVFGVIDVRRVDESAIDDPVKKALDVLGVDFYLAFPNGTLLAGQEKFLSFGEREWRTATVSTASWKHCAAQVYFVGYLTQDCKAFDPWVLMNWPSVMLATARGRIRWTLKESQTGYISFWWTSLDSIPKECLIASHL